MDPGGPGRWGVDPPIVASAETSAVVQRSNRGREPRTVAKASAFRRSPGFNYEAALVKLLASRFASSYRVP